jgi:hypothetical protein
VLGGGADIDRIVGVIGRPYSIVTPGMSVKPYPVRRAEPSEHGRDAEAGGRRRCEAGSDQGDALRAGSNILEPLRYKTAKTELEAKFCVPFLLAASRLRRKAGVREFTDEFVSSAPVQRMMTLVTTIFDPAIEARGFDKIRSVVEIDLTDGRGWCRRQTIAIAAAPIARSRARSCTRSSPIAPS